MNGNEKRNHMEINKTQDILACLDDSEDDEMERLQVELVDMNLG